MPAFSETFLEQELKQATRGDSVIRKEKIYEGWEYFPRETVDKEPKKFSIHLRRSSRYIDIPIGPDEETTATVGIGYQSGGGGGTISGTTTLKWKDAPKVEAVYDEG